MKLHQKWPTLLLLLLMAIGVCAGELPKLEIISAYCGGENNKIDVTQKFKDLVQQKTYLKTHNNFRIHGKELRGDERITVLKYRLGETEKTVVLKPGQGITVGALAPRYIEGTPEWTAHFIDRTKGGLQHGFSVSSLRCPFCKGNVTYHVKTNAEEMLCTKCKKVLDESVLPTAGTDYFDGMAFEYALVNGEKFYFLPYMRYARARIVPGLAGGLARLSQRTKDLKLAQTVLDMLNEYGDYYKKNICERVGKKFLRRGYPYGCNYARIRNFGDVYQTYGFCMTYRIIESTGLAIKPEERARFRSFMENMISEVALPYIRQTGGMGNPMPGVYGDCLIVGMTFPEAKIIDRMRNNKIMSGTDLVHDSYSGNNGFLQYMTNTTYADGLAKERSVSYNRMITSGNSNYLKNRLPLYKTPAGYDAAAAGYSVMTGENPEKREAFQRALFEHTKVCTPDGNQFPIGDTWGGGSKPAVKNENPLSESTIFAGWGMGALRLGQKENASAAFLNCGSTLDGHCHNDMFSLMFWADNLLMLNTTEYPANNYDIAPIQWWRAAAAAHNTAIIDGENHPRQFHRSMTLWGFNKLSAAVQAQGTISEDPQKTMRRTSILIDSRPGKIPYLVDFVELNGGKTGDLFFQAQSFIGEKYETLTVRNPRLVPSKAADLQKRLKSDPKAELGWVKNLSEAPLSGNAELEWYFPSGSSAKHLRGILVPAPGERLITGDAPGVRYPRVERSKTGPQRTVRKVVRHAEFHNQKPISFISVFESRKDSGAYTVSQVKTLPCIGGTALLVSHGDGIEDLILVAPEKNSGVMRTTFDGKQVAFDGRLAVLSKKNHSVEYSTIGGSSLAVGGKTIRLSPDIRGRLLSHDKKTTVFFVDEVPAVVDVSVRPEQLKVGQTMIVSSKTGVTIPYRITKIEPGNGNGSQVTLDRPARLGRASVKNFSPDGKTFDLASAIPGLKTGLRVLFGKESGTISQISRRRIVLDRPIKTTPKPNQAFVLNEIGENDEFVIHPVGSGKIQ